MSIGGGRSVEGVDKEIWAKMREARRWGRCGRWSCKLEINFDNKHANDLQFRNFLLCFLEVTDAGFEFGTWWIFNVEDSLGFVDLLRVWARFNENILRCGLGFHSLDVKTALKFIDISQFADFMEIFWETRCTVTVCFWRMFLLIDPSLYDINMNSLLMLRFASRELMGLFCGFLRSKLTQRK